MKKSLVITLCLSILVLSCGNSKKEDKAQKTETKSPIQDSKLTESIKRGSEIYKDFCFACHLPNGVGVSGAFPPLAKSDFLMNNREESIKAIKFGMTGEVVVNGETYNSAMASLGLADDEVADVMNYISNSWGNKNNTLIKEEDVSKIQQ